MGAEDATCPECGQPVTRHNAMVKWVGGRTCMSCFFMAYHQASPMADPGAIEMVEICEPLKRKTEKKRREELVVPAMEVIVYSVQPGSEAMDETSRIIPQSPRHIIAMGHFALTGRRVRQIVVTRRFWAPYAERHSLGAALGLPVDWPEYIG